MKIIKPSKRSRSGIDRLDSQADLMPETGELARFEESELDISRSAGRSDTRRSISKSDQQPLSARRRDNRSYSSRSLESPSSRIKESQGSDTGLTQHTKSPREKAYSELLAKGVRLLSMREHSVKELTDKLKAKPVKKNHAPAKLVDVDLVYAVIEELVESLYLSDERFTESYVRSRSNRGFGPVKIRTELNAKGISNILVEEHLKLNAAHWFDHAQAQYHKKYGDSPVSDYNTWSKRARFMQSRGFTMEHIQVSLPRVDFD